MINKNKPPSAIPKRRDILESLVEQVYQESRSALTLAGKLVSSQGQELPKNLSLVAATLTSLDLSENKV